MATSTPASRSGTGTGQPVTRLVAPVVVRVGALVGAMAVVCIVAVVGATRATTYLTDELYPAIEANNGTLTTLSQMEAAVNAWMLTGDPAAQGDYEAALAQLPADEQTIREFTLEGAQLRLLVVRQQETAENWISQYADPRMASVGGYEEFDRTRYDSGAMLFDDFVEVHAETEARLDIRLENASRDATFRFRGTLIAVILLASMAWFVMLRARRTLLAELSEPLRELEAAVQKMGRNDETVRAVPRGSKEVRSVATALNEFADGRAQASAVEGRIQDELRVLDSAKDDFVSNISHELRTPLTTISGYLELIAEEFEEQLQPRHQRMLEASRRNVTRLKALIDDLLALSKAENRSTTLEASDVVPMVRDAVTDVRITAARRGIKVQISTPDEAMLVLSERAMLMRAFVNVLSNAVKFSHDNGVVQVKVTRMVQMVEISVSDQGIGIPKAEIERLGSRFFRASNAVTNEIAGTGLGLRIVQTIVEKHAGDVAIESAEGSGTTVIIRLRLHGEQFEVGAKKDGGSDVSSIEPKDDADE